jgi:hypothetical protein
MRPNITITLQLGPWPSREDKIIVLPLDDRAVREASSVLDFPTDDAPVAIKAFICTPPDVLRRAQQNRKALADAAADHVRAKLLEVLGGRDTLMGYKRPANQE